MANSIGYTDTLTGKEYHFGSWKQMAQAVVGRSNKEKDWARFLPFCNGYNLDYPERDEPFPDYRNRMVDMAIGLQLI